MYMVISMTTQKAYDHDMVVEDYYKKEMTLNEKLQKIENGKLYAADIKFNANPNGLLLSFPEKLKGLSEASIFAYRASDKALDFNSPIALNSQGEALVNRSLKRGFWKFTLAFTYQNKDYLITKSITVQ